MSNGQYRLEAFGIQSDWNLWRIAHGGLDEPEIEDHSPYGRMMARRLYESDFGSLEDLNLAMMIFPALEDDLDHERRDRMVISPRMVVPWRDK